MLIKNYKLTGLSLAHNNSEYFEVFENLRKTQDSSDNLGFFYELSLTQDSFFYEKLRTDFFLDFE